MSVHVLLRWETRVPGEVNTREYRNSDGTFTVQSDYILVPSKETHKETLTCVTTYNEEVFTDSVTLDIQCRSLCDAERPTATKTDVYKRHVLFFV